MNNGSGSSTSFKFTRWQDISQLNLTYILEFKYKGMGFTNDGEFCTSNVPPHTALATQGFYCFLHFCTATYNKKTITTLGQLGNYQSKTKTASFNFGESQPSSSNGYLSQTSIKLWRTLIYLQPHMFNNTFCLSILPFWILIKLCLCT